MPKNVPNTVFDFTDNVAVTPGCWLWNGPLNKFGYGRISWNGKTTVAHRISWMLHKGSIPDGSMVLHKCDVRHCVNPAHLFLGDAKANAADMMKKQRHRSQKTTVCSNGHPYTAESIRRDKNGKKNCRLCDAAKDLLAKQRRLTVAASKTIAREMFYLNPTYLQPLHRCMLDLARQQSGERARSGE